MVNISYLFNSGALVNFEVNELVRLVQALFTDTALQTIDIPIMYLYIHLFISSSQSGLHNICRRQSLPASGHVADKRQAQTDRKNVRVESLSTFQGDPQLARSPLRVNQLAWGRASPARIER
ncbi:hypothetical protein C8R44DRAFT_739748 [Mycena epipterygia]|nr:hypothetical protein C8R44DRAFT_739748 [Mycena epipterygia]